MSCLNKSKEKTAPLLGDDLNFEDSNRVKNLCLSNYDLNKVNL